MLHGEVAEEWIDEDTLTGLLIISEESEKIITDSGHFLQ